jgi:hypothetical protein
MSVAVARRWRSGTLTIMQPKGLIPVVVYLLVWVAALVTLYACKVLGVLPEWATALGVGVDATLVGGLAGCLYCLRAVYLNHSVHSRWDGSRWNIWYVLRPITSCMAGGVSLIFLNAGLLALDAKPDGGAAYGYLAAAFFAGFNVDRFLQHVEEIGQTTFGIKPTRSADASDAQTRKTGD